MRICPYCGREEKVIMHCPIDYTPLIHGIIHPNEEYDK